MAATTSETLSKRVKSGEIEKKRDAIYLLYGNEAGRISDAANDLKKALLANLGSEEDYFRYLKTGTGPEETGIGEVIAQLNTVSMFGGGKLVWLGHLDNIDKDTQRALLSYCKDPNPQSALIITLVFDKEAWGNPVAKFEKSPFLKEIVKTVVVASFRAVKGRGLRQWVTSRLHQEGFTIGEQAADLLIELCGHDTSRLGTEIVKLANYADGQKEVTLGDVEVMVGDFRTEKAWDLTNAVGRLDTAWSQAALSNLLKNNTPAQMILKIITTEIMRIATALDCRARGESFNSFCAQLGGSPYPLKIVWANSVGWTPQLTRRGLRATLKAYMDIMKGGVDPETGLHAMLLDILNSGSRKTGSID